MSPWCLHVLPSRGCDCSLAERAHVQNALPLWGEVAGQSVLLSSEKSGHLKVTFFNTNVKRGKNRKCQFLFSYSPERPLLYAKARLYHTLRLHHTGMVSGEFLPETWPKKQTCQKEKVLIFKESFLLDSRSHGGEEVLRKQKEISGLKEHLLLSFRKMEKEAFGQCSSFPWLPVNFLQGA